MTRKPQSASGKATSKKAAKKPAAKKSASEKIDSEKTDPKRTTPVSDSGSVPDSSVSVDIPTDEKLSRGATAPSVSPKTSGLWIRFLIALVFIGIIGAGATASKDIWWPYAEPYIPKLESKDDPRVAVLMDRLNALEEKIQDTDTTTLTVNTAAPSSPVSDETFQALEETRQKLNAELVAVIKRLESIEQSMETVKLMATAVETGEGNAEIGLSVESLRALAERVNTLEQVATRDQSSDFNTVTARLDDLEQQTQTVDTALSDKARLLEDVKRRIDGLESLQSANANAINPTTSALILAIGQLREVIRQGDNYRREIENVVALVTNALPGHTEADQLINTLQEHADTGIVPQTALRRSFNDVSVNILKADRKIDGDGWISAAINRLGNLVMVRRVDHSAAADTTDARLSRAEADLAVGDLAAAIAVLSGLTGPAREAAEQWLEQAQASLAVEQALTALNSIAIAQITLTQN